MPRAVRFDRYGGLEVLKVVEVERPRPQAGEVLVRVKAAGISPGESAIREGRMHDRRPGTFPSGQGSDFAGVVEEVGEGVASWRPGEEVIGFSDRRSSQAELVVVEESHLVARPASVPWEVAGGLFVAGTTAYAAVEAVRLKPGETLVVSAAAGGVGSIVVQLAGLTGASVIGLASKTNHPWLIDHGVRPLVYGGGVAERIEEIAKLPIDAFIDTFGRGYVDLALSLGVKPDRIETIIDFEAAERHRGVKTAGNSSAANAKALAKLAALVAEGKLEVPIAGVYPLEDVQVAYRELERRHTHGKIVLVP